MRINCQEKGGLRRLFAVEVTADATVQNVREGLAPQCKTKLAGILLFDGDEYLQNHVRLEEYGVGDGATLNYEARMCGILPADHDWSASGVKTKAPMKRFAF
jgi:hypothetical protein